MRKDIYDYAAKNICLTYRAIAKHYGMHERSVNYHITSIDPNFSMKQVAARAIKRNEICEFVRNNPDANIQILHEKFDMKKSSIYKHLREAGLKPKNSLIKPPPRKLASIGFNARDPEAMWAAGHKTMFSKQALNNF